MAGANHLITPDSYQLLSIYKESTDFVPVTWAGLGFCALQRTGLLRKQQTRSLLHFCG